MSFSTIQVTAKGRALLARAQTGTMIKFTRIKMGDGLIGSRVIDEMADVINQKANLGITALKVLPGGKAKVSAAYTNQGLTEGFYWRELAVFAEDPDNSSKEIMYCYGNAGALADYIPAEGSQILEKVISVQAIISNASSVTALIDSSNIYVTTQEFDELVTTVAATQNTANGVMADLNSHLSDNLYQTAKGTTTAITLTISETLVNGFPITFIASDNNNGAATTINGKPLFKPNTIIAPVLISGKAYTVWYSSSGDCFFIKANEGGDCKFSNLIKFGNFNSSITAELWTGNASVNTVVANKMKNVGTGGWHAPNTHYSFNLATYVNQKIYVRVTLKALDTGCLSLSIYTTDGDNNQVVAATRYSEIVQNHEYVLSGISTQVANTSNLNFFVRHGYADSAAATGKTLEISKVMVSDLTDRYGEGQEPSAEECDALAEKFGGWWDSDLKLLTADATASTNTIVNTYTAYINGNKVRGTIPVFSGYEYTPKTTNLIISGAQYISNQMTIKGDTNLLASNIKNGTSIFGVTGTYKSPITAGTTLIYQDTTLKTITSSLRTKVRDVQMLKGGTIRTIFSLATSSTSGQAWGIIYVNGVARGIERLVSSTTYTEFSEDITVNAGDYVQLYIQSSSSSYTAKNSYFYLGISTENDILKVI